MKLPDVVRSAVAVGRTAKERQVRRGYKRGVTDIAPSITAYRGIEPIAVVCMEGGREDFIETASVVAAGFAADLIAMTHDSYAAAGDCLTKGINPLTGEDWKPGEMQDVAENHDGLARGWLKECLVVMAANRAGDVAACSTTYRLSGPYVAWADEWLIEEGAEGFIPDALRGIMQREPQISEHLVLAGTGLTVADFGIDSADVARAHMDCATAKLLGSILGSPVVALFSGSGERDRVIRESFGAGTSILRPPNLN